MNLWIKVMVLLVFSELKCLNAEDSKCLKYLEDVGKCYPFTAAISLDGLMEGLKGMGSVLGGGKTPNVTVVTADETCCQTYYTACLEIKAIRKHCEKATGSDLNKRAKEGFQSAQKCAPTKEKCTPFHKKTLPGDCEAYSECQSYTWSSFTPKSLNGLVLWLSLIVYFIIVSQFI